MKLDEKEHNYYFWSDLFDNIREWLFGVGLFLLVYDFIFAVAAAIACLVLLPFMGWDYLGSTTSPIWVVTLAMFLAGATMLVISIIWSVINDLYF